MSKTPSVRSSSTDVSKFLAKVRSHSPGKGRLIFALDATASREASWDRACALHGEMFDTAASLGGISVQLAYYRGYREFRHSSWSKDPAALLKEMTSVRCAGGRTQINRVLQHALAEDRATPLGALVFIGDAFEEEIDACCEYAGELGIKKTPVFAFQEGNDPAAERAFRQIATLSKGAYCKLDANSADLLKELLRAVAAYVAGGAAQARQLESKHPGTRQLLENL